MGFDRLVSNQPQYSMLWRVIEAEVVPASRELGMSQIVWSPMAQGVLTGKYLPGQPPPEGSRATDASGGNFIRAMLNDDLLERVQGLKPIAADHGLSMAQLAVAWVLQTTTSPRRSSGRPGPSRCATTSRPAGVRLEPEVLAAHRRRPRRRGRPRPGQDRRDEPPPATRLRARRRDPAVS